MKDVKWMMELKTIIHFFCDINATSISNGFSKSETIKYISLQTLKIKQY